MSETLSNVSSKASERPDFLQECVTLPTIKKRYNVSLTTVYNWIDDGLPSFKLGRERLIHIPTCDAWVKAKLTGSAHQHP